MTPEQLLVEVEDVLRTLPKAGTLNEFAEEVAWLGRATAVIGAWNPILMPGFGLAINELQRNSHVGYRKMLTMLHQCHQDLRMKTTGPVNVAVAAGEVFVYFDEVRKKIELATNDVFFVDPYLDAEFVTNYPPRF